jgi:hypothetical protein
MTFTTNLLVASSNSIKLQASTLAQLTQATNQLTQRTSVKPYRFFFFQTMYFDKNRCLLRISVIN